MTTCSVINPSGAGLTTWKVPNFIEVMPDSYPGAIASLVAAQVYHRAPELSSSFCAVLAASNELEKILS
jgi:hypothetical protein